MKIESITLRQLNMRLRAPFETSFGVAQDRNILVVETCADGMVGWGEMTVMEGPYFNSETTGTAWHVMHDFIAPLIVGTTINHASEIPSLLQRIRGHEMTKGGVENSVWDIEAQELGVSLSSLVGGTRREIACGVSLGIQESASKLIATIERELTSGYQRIKLKIKPGTDVDYVAAARAAFPDIMLSVDANAAYTTADTAHLQKLDAYKLLMIEQPLWWNELFAHAQLQAQLDTAICLDECIQNARHAQAAIEMCACRIVNIKLGRVGGHSEAQRVHGVAQKYEVPVWCGGMLESGIGRAHNIAMSSLPGFTLPGDISASRRYWEEDIIEPEVEVSPMGTTVVPDTPGLGFTPRTKLIEALTVRKETWKPGVSVRVFR
jgi:O-succinylbenzoate synthase